MLKMELIPYEQSSLFFIRTITPLHIGTGRTVGIVDMPIEKDSFNLPIIPASSIKGAIRSSFYGDPLEQLLFGPKPGEEPFTGAFTPLDAYLVAIPARSLKGVWTLVTAELALRRLKEQACLVGANNLIESVEQYLREILEINLKHNEIALSKDEAKEKLSVDDEVILNEEFRFKVKIAKSLDGIAEYLLPDERWRLVAIHDDMFIRVVDRSLLRRARVRISPSTKTVEEGGLWREEDVPPNSIFATIFFYSKLRANDERINRLKNENAKEGAKRMRENACEVRNYIEKKLLQDSKQGYLVLGGHETIGRGLIKVMKYERNS